MKKVYDLSTVTATSKPSVKERVIKIDNNSKNINSHISLNCTYVNIGTKMFEKQSKLFRK